MTLLGDVGLRNSCQVFSASVDVRSACILAVRHSNRPAMDNLLPIADATCSYLVSFINLGRPETMKFRLSLICIATSLALGACAFSPEKIGALPLPPVRIVQKSYSFLPPAQPNWILVERDAFRVALVRRIDEFDGTGAIQATLATPVFDGSAQGLLNFVSERAESSLENQTRFEKRTADHQIVVQQGQSCVRAEYLSLDKQARTQDGGTIEMLLNSVQLVCPLPEEPRVVLSFTYSVRYRALAPKTGVREDAEKLFESIRFSGKSKAVLGA